MIAVCSVITHSEEETFAAGRNFGLKLKKQPALVCFFGELAAGKTTFIKGLVAGAADYDPLLVSSPTFSYLNIYSGAQTIYHFDLYRLNNEEEFLQMGFGEIVDSEVACCVEWAEKISSICPKKHIRISLQHAGKDKRKITIEYHEKKSSS